MYQLLAYHLQLLGNCWGSCGSYVEKKGISGVDNTAFGYEHCFQPFFNRVLKGNVDKFNLHVTSQGKAFGET